MISDLTIYPSSTIRCLGFLLDSSLSFNPQILSVASSCFFHLRRIRQISFYLDDASLKILVCSLVFFRLDYCNSLYFNLLKSTLYPLIKAFNSAARRSHTPKFSHISPSLVDLHWLPPHFRFFFKICTLMYKISHSTSPSYFSNLLLVLNFSLSLSLTPILNLLFFFLVHFSGTLFLLILNLLPILFSLVI